MNSDSKPVESHTTNVTGRSHDQDLKMNETVAQTETPTPAENEDSVDTPDLGAHLRDSRSQELHGNDLNAIATPWTQLELAEYSKQADERQAAQAAILQRYGNAIHRYLLAITRDEQLAMDLGQEFALRFLQGNFRNIGREKGRFRNYVKKVISNLVVDVHRRRQREDQFRQNADQQKQLVDQSAAVNDENGETLTQIWRTHLLKLAWKELENESQEGKPPYYQVLKLRVQFPAETIKQLEVRLRDIATGYTESGFRQVLCRARQRFRELLWEEIAKSCGTPERDSIEQEICDLGLKKYFADN